MIVFRLVVARKGKERLLIYGPGERVWRRQYDFQWGWSGEYKADPGSVDVGDEIRWQGRWWRVRDVYWEEWPISPIGFGQVDWQAYFSRAKKLGGHLLHKVLPPLPRPRRRA